jgi:riboflavin kinase / FMN adenylyltransferase
MRILHSWNEWNESADCHLAIGAFDGLHRGHQALFKKTLTCARDAQGQAWVLTFAPHPSRILQPDKAPLLLTSTEHKERLLRDTDLDGCIMHPFTMDLSRLEPESFFQELLTAIPRLRTIVVGPNWRFGRQAKGNTDLLKDLARANGIEAHIHEPVVWHGSPVSSTRIRHAIENGRLEEAEQMLGRPYSLWGEVTTGKQYGRALGFPTANIRLQDECRPPLGVYAVKARVNGHRYNGAAYLGWRAGPHDEKPHPLLEVHVFDVALDLYGQHIEVAFIKYLRGDQRFETHDALRAQIARDVQQARALFGLA